MRPARKVPFLSLSLALVLAVAALIEPVFAQQQPQEKRVALVVGDGAYAKAPLATAANDAGLIAQTLQAAGFDVIGARDLDADTLRKSFHDFMAKVQASPADTVAVIYLAGYGLQLSGENYFIPVDANVNSATDIPIEGLRISDYTRELASVPLKASVVILDIARQQPFVDGGPQPLASGLSLVDASPNMLIAFNAAPGTVAPNDPGPYGVYAQSLAEMIRTGGLSLPELFDRVRLRVSENSKGAQIPWDDQKIQAQFTFFDRAPDAPPVQGSPDQVAAIEQKPMRGLSVQDAYSAALARDSMQGYEDFLAAYPRDPLSRRVRAILAARREAITWRRTYLADTPQAYWSYLRRYPDGPHAWDARRRLEIIRAALEPPPSFAMIDYDVPPPPPDEIVFVDRPVFYFGDPDFDFAPPPPPPIYYLPPPPPDFVILAPPIIAVGVVGVFVLPRPMFVPMPVFVRPPVYVAPPPNNIIFNNIHNTTVINNVINNPAPAPAATPGAPASAPVAAAPALPAAVAQRASLIQQGKVPPPPSLSINPTAKPGTPPTTPANAPSGTTAPQQPLSQQKLPQQNALPAPGKGTTPQQPLKPQNALPVPGKGTTPPAPKAATAPTTTMPGTKTPGTTTPGTTNPNAKGVNTTPPQTGKPNLREEKSNLQQKGTPGTTPSTTPGKPGLTTTAPTKPEALEKRTPTTPPTAAKPALKPEVKPEAKSIKPPPPPPPAPKAEAKHAPPPPPRPAPPPPKPMAAPKPPPPPPPRAAPPPPRIAAPPPPRPAPPPPPRPAPPPPRMAAPPPPRPAPPPPRPAPPPPRPAAPAKHCPPNQPRC
ncbi:MAG TPA: caspase domain-containing protein [Bradyrhizobium sp.]|uniref:caspase domain-containing protein n=1 Tax=Bradyrhizobium sp. TaxID=376 RepID=UPI002BADD210|nr:caspase domain-containing protein [Bradyrhizobium sp.]HLZ02615.1 caspase domain-containing protein [Bradyrhizobium sp.]